MDRNQITSLLTLVEQQYGRSKVFSNSLLFLTWIPDNALPTSIIFNHIDEEISMFWDNGIMFLDVGLDKNKQYQYSGFHRAQAFENSGSLTNGLTPDIKQFLFKFSNL